VFSNVTEVAELQAGVEKVLENSLLTPEHENGSSRAAPASGERPLAAGSWYAISIRPRHEKTVVRHLSHQGLNCFLPIYRSLRRWKDRRKELEMALFPGYVFVNVNVRNRRGVALVPGVERFVTLQGQPAAVPESEVRTLESKCRQIFGRNLIRTSAEAREFA
jgi:transcription antitermination factor NusG